MSVSRRVSAGVVALLGLGCGDYRDAEDDDGLAAGDDAAQDTGVQTSTDDGAATSGTASADEGTTGAGTAATDSDGDDADTTEGFVFDVANRGDLPVDTTCHAVDFLFVIDNSDSMAAVQNNLVANFGGFIDGIQSTLDTVSAYHVGIVTTDAYIYNEIGCNAIGELVTWTGGDASSNAMCEFAEGNRFMTEADDLPGAFACAAQVGTEGSWSERPIDAMLAAISPELTADGECNDGFVRSDALLVVVVISDEPEGEGDPEGPPPDSSAGTPDAWYQAIVDAKLGHPENAVVMTLTGDTDPFPDNIADFAALFGDNGFSGPIWGDYGPLFTDATDIVAEACENFVPPG